MFSAYLSDLKQAGRSLLIVTACAERGDVVFVNQEKEPSNESNYPDSCAGCHFFGHAFDDTAGA